MNRRASVASRRAYASAPTRRRLEDVPSPATTMLPDSTSSPARLGDRVGLAGQQRLVELEPVAVRTMPSAGT